MVFHIIRADILPIARIFPRRFGGSANFPLVINSVDKSNIRFYSPPTQHRSFFRN